MKVLSIVMFMLLLVIFGLSFFAGHESLHPYLVVLVWVRRVLFGIVMVVAGISMYKLFNTPRKQKKGY
jgi:cation transport ATPase